MLEVIKKTSELTLLRQSEKLDIGFVPTMGNLHQGHISLLLEALKEFKVVYFSIFVNPKQFGPSEDFNRYPRTLEQDIELIRSAMGEAKDSKVVIYAPTDPKEVFPDLNEETLSVLKLNTILEGKIRPGHFEGVATVVYRLFDLVKPQKAYFGLKDFQQYHVIKQMVKDLCLPIKIQGMPIIREKEGLALSSRNQYLANEQKSESLILFNTLNEIKNIINHKKENIDKAMSYITKALRDPNWNYLEIRDTDSFSENLAQSKNITILGVYQFGSTRLLDNMQVEVK